eukprot:scaffold22093_cov145-Isochrysis_galbana.AAC.3
MAQLTVSQCKAGCGNAADRFHLGHLARTPCADTGSFTCESLNRAALASAGAPHKIQAHSR